MGRRPDDITTARWSEEAQPEMGPTLAPLLGEARPSPALDSDKTLTAKSVCEIVNGQQGDYESKCGIKDRLLKQKSQRRPRVP